MLADGVHLSAIYGVAAAVAAAMGLLPFAVVGRPPGSVGAEPVSVQQEQRTQC